MSKWFGWSAMPLLLWLYIGRLNETARQRQEERANAYGSLSSFFLCVYVIWIALARTFAHVFTSVRSYAATVKFSKTYAKIVNHRRLFFWTPLKMSVHKRTLCDRMILYRITFHKGKEGKKLVNAKSSTIKSIKYDEQKIVSSRIWQIQFVDSFRKCVAHSM